MRKTILAIILVIALVFSFGCSKEWMAHDTVYKTNQHMWFSWFGYLDADAADLECQRAQGGWWGEPIEIQ